MTVLFVVFDNRITKLFIRTMTMMGQDHPSREREEKVPATRKRKHGEILESQINEERWMTWDADSKFSYQVSTCGRFRNLTTNTMLTCYQKPNGLRYWRLRNRIGRFTEKSVARWMCIAFRSDEVRAMETKNTKWRAIHLDYVSDNDILSNIACVSVSDGAAKVWTSNKKRKNSGIARKKPIRQIDPLTGVIRDWPSCIDVERANLGFIASNVSRCANGLSKKGLAYKFQWKWIISTLPGETWRDCEIPRHQGMKWSDLGRVQTTFGVRTRGTKLSHGYLSIWCTGKATLVHQLIAREAMQDAYEACVSRSAGTVPQVWHLDGNRANNNLTNLQWMTPVEGYKSKQD